MTTAFIIFTGYYNYLHMDFGRPTILVVPREDESLLITPSMEMDMVEVSAVVDGIRGWNDGMGKEWREDLSIVLEGTGRMAVEPDKMPPVVLSFIKNSGWGRTDL